MTNETGLVVFGEDWGAHPSSTQHLMRHIAERRRVLWVNSVGLRRPRFNRKDLARAAGKVAAMIEQRRRPATDTNQPTASHKADLPPGMELLSPVAVSWPSSRIAFQANRTLLRRQIRERLTKMSMERPILWASFPSALPAVGELGERKVVYYCGDDFGALVGVDHEPIMAMEKRLVERADLVLAASELLASRFPASKTVLVPHGVDLGRFATPVPRADDMPDEGRPIAGFYGSISDWIDTSLLAAAATKLPDWTFVMIGPIHTDVTQLQACPNIRFLGPRPHAELARYVQHWDVSLVPFRKTPQIDACNPLKLREYLAAGRPVASVDFPALAPYRAVVSVGEGADGFTAAIRTAYADGARNAERRAIVAGESWAERAAHVERELARL